MADLPTKPAKRAPAKWTKLTPALTERYLEAVKQRLPLYLCAAAAGVTRETVIEWRKRAAEGEEPFASFWAKVEAERARGAKVLLGRVSRASKDPKNWKAAVWLLERCYQPYEDSSTGSSVPQVGENRHVIDAGELDPERLLLERIDRTRSSLASAQADGSHVAAMQLSRELDRALGELQELRRSKSDPAHKDEASFVADLAAAAELMPHSHLQVFVDEYLRRHRCKVVPDETAARGDEDDDGEES